MKVPLQRKKTPISAIIRRSSPTLLGLVFLALFGLKLTPSFAEGSKNFVGYEGYRMFLDTRDPQQLKVYAAEGETINVGSSHVGIQGGFIHVYDPQGNLVATFDGFDDSGAATDVGIIFNSQEEMSGPTGGGSTNGTGYEPGTITVPAGQGGIWTVIYDYPSYVNTSFTNILNDAAWTRAADQPDTRRVVLAWDITVTTGGAGNEGGAPIDGRVYSNEHISLLNGNNFTTSPIFYVLTEDGYLYQVNINEADPFRFPISSNSFGLVEKLPNGNITPIYKSKPEADFIRSDDTTGWLANQIYLYEPQAEGQGGLVNNKIFFNRPSSDLPSSAPVTDIFRDNSHDIWLLNEIDTFILENPYFAGFSVDGDLCAGNNLEFEKGGFFYFESNIGGSITLQLDLNNNGSFNDDVDVSIMDILNSGLDSVFWDGFDGLGNAVPIQDSLVINYQGEIRFGELHIALTDVEGSNGGVTFEWLNPFAGLPANQFYYDHSDIFPGSNTVSGGGTPGNALPTTTPYMYPLFEGNDRYIDQWFFLEFEIEQTELVLNVVVDCVCPQGNPEISANDVSVCEGDALTLTATNAATGVGDLTYTWSNASGFSFTETIGEGETSSAFVTANAGVSNLGTYTVIATNAEGCADTATVTVSIELLPNIIGGIAGGGDFCPGDDATLIGVNATAGIGDVTNFTWSGPDNFSQSGSVTGSDQIAATISNLSAAQVGTYSLTMTSQNGCVGGPFTVDVSLFSPPVLTSDDLNPGACAGENVTICATNTETSVSTMTCTWDGPNGFIEQSTVGGGEQICLTLTNVDVSFDGIYTLVCSSNGCPSAPLDFNFSVQPNPEINGISPSGDFCVGDDVTLTAQNVTAGTGDLTYTWSDPDGVPLFTGTAPENGNFAYTLTNIQPDQAGSYTLQLATAAGCSAVPQSTTIGVAPTPEVCDVTGGGDACVGQDMTFAAFNCIASVQPVTWTWTGPSGVIGTNTVNTDGPYQVELTNLQVGDSGEYCITLVSGTTNCTSETVCVNLSVLPGLNVVDLTADDDYCPGSTVTLTGNATITSGTITYTWTGPNGAVCTNTVAATEPLTCTISNVAEGDEGDYVLTATSDAGCTYESGPVNVNVFADAEILTVTGGGEFCADEAVELSGTGGGAAAMVDYEWTSPSGEVVGSGNTPVEGPFPGNDATPEDGTYTLTITTADECTDTETVNVTLGCTPIAEIQFTDTTLCELDTLTLCGRNLNTDCDNMVYTWLTPNGVNITGPATGTDVFCDEVLPLATYGTGTYYLFISSGNCTSLADSVEITLNPNPIISEISGGGTYCVGDTAVLCFTQLNPEIDDFFYTCNLPGGIQVTESGVFGEEICIEITEPGFVFCSIESQEGCISSLEGAEVLFTSGFDLTATSNSPVCSNETLELDGTNAETCDGDANYEWIAPDGEIIFTGTAPCEGPFPASVPNPTLSGEYCLVVFADGSNCTDTSCVDVEIFPAPEVTIGIDGGGEFCVGESTTLTATIEKMGGGDIDYVWTQDGTEVASGTAASGDEVTLVLDGLTLDDDGEYCLELICPANDCTNDPPSCTTVTVNQTPDITDITGAGTYCEGVDVLLTASGTTGPGDVDYTWTGPNFTFSGTAPCGGPYPATIGGIGQNQAGAYTLTLVKGTCENEQTITISVNPTPIVTVSADQIGCEGGTTPITVTVDPNGANSVDWQLTGPGIDTSSTTDVLVTFEVNVAAMDGDTYTLTGTSDQGCEADVSTATVSTQTIPPPTLTASPNPLCPGEGLDLTTGEQAGDEVSYCWYLDGEILETTDVPTLNIPNPTAGDYTVQAKVDGCDETSSPVSVTIFAAPNAENDSASGDQDTDIPGEVLGNDTPNSGVTITITNQPDNGTVVLNDDGTFVYTPNPGYSGTDQFAYEICLVECPELCDEAVVDITVSPTACIIPNVITPNGDGTNDVLIINCAISFPNNSLRIFNRWGDEIYVAEPYENTWDGNDEGEEVPVSTYFYLWLPDRDKGDDQQAGYIRVQR